MRRRKRDFPYFVSLGLVLGLCQESGVWKRERSHHWWNKKKEEGNVLFNDALNTFYLRLYGVGHMVKDHSVREKTRCRHMGYSFRLTARVLLYAPPHRQDSTYHGLWYTSRGALAGTRNSSMGPPHEGSIRRPPLVERCCQTDI